MLPGYIVIAYSPNNATVYIEYALIKLCSFLFYSLSYPSPWSSGTRCEHNVRRNKADVIAVGMNVFRMK